MIARAQRPRFSPRAGRWAALVVTVVTLPLLAAGCLSKVVAEPKRCAVGDTTYAVGDHFPSPDGCNTCTCESDGTSACTAMGCVTGCTYGGKQYAVGESFPSSDGCNTCSCDASGSVMCTEMACASGCDYAGQHYDAGQSFPSSDGCNTCSCMGDGTVGCTAMACSSGCDYEGQHYEAGQSFPAGDGCNTCSCMDGGGVACTEMACPTCVYAGNTYTPGATFPALDGCNTCQCAGDGSVGCSKMACACDPAKEWYRKYLGHSPKECAVIDFQCPPNTVGFENDCGCGCEQNAKCPEYFDCMPPAPCDPKKLQEECPYSGIAL